MAKGPASASLPPVPLQIRDLSALVREPMAAVSGWPLRRLGRGVVDAWDVIAWLWRERQESRADEDPDESPGRAEALERWRAAKADLAEIDLLVRRGVLIDRVAAEAAEAARAAAAQTYLLQVPHRAEMEQGLTPEQAEGLRRLIADSLQALAAQIETGWDDAGP